jgi:DNA-binding MarR family transcriptional regulator
MTSSALQLGSHGILWEQYRSNLPRHLIGLTRYMQTRLMHTLTEARGHRALRLNFEPFITLVGSRGAGMTELAEILAVSKQAVNQAVNQVEAAGYVERVADPSDGRARRVQLTALGRKLMADGSELLHTVLAEFEAKLGERQLLEFSRMLGALHSGLALRGLRTTADTVDSAMLLGALLPRISDHIMQRLMELTRASGHPGLKMSFQQVLIMLGPEGGSIRDMARVQGVSKQAISAIVAELEQLAYVQRLTDPRDARQVVVSLTSAGIALLQDSASSVVELEQEFSAILGTQGLKKLKEFAADLYAALHLEEEVLGPSPERENDLTALARRLMHQLGRQKANELALLLSQFEEEVIA